RGQGRRDSTVVRAVVRGAGAGVRRSERSGERGVAAVAIAARQQAARGARDAAEGHLSRAPDAGMTALTAQKINDDLLRPLLQTSWRFYLLVSVLGAIVIAGLATWIYQMWMGFGITGINMPIYWAF